jgi:hypothetical protein
MSFILLIKRIWPKAQSQKRRISAGAGFTKPSGAARFGGLWQTRRTTKNARDFSRGVFSVRQNKSRTNWL